MVTLTGATRSSVRISPIRIGVRDLPSVTVIAGFLYGDTDPIVVPPGTKVGIGYLNRLSGDFFQLGANMQWSKVGNVRGPQGAAGVGFTDEALQQIKTLVEADIVPAQDLTVQLEASLQGDSSLQPNGADDVDLTLLLDNALA